MHDIRVCGFSEITIAREKVGNRANIALDIAGFGWFPKSPFVSTNHEVANFATVNH